jgi:hypothetical protein
MATARSDLKFTVGADMSPFAATMRRVGMTAQSTAAKVATSFKSSAAAIGRISIAAARAGAAITGLGAAAGGALFAKGIKSAADLGGTLSDVSAQTGIAAGNVAVLQRAFEDAGVGADQVGSVINKLQRAIIDAAGGSEKASKNFQKLGLDVVSISKLSPDAQFAAVAKAMEGIADPAERASIAMGIFGKSGGKLLAVFGDKGALAGAGEFLGTQAEILNRQAGLFDTVSDKLGRIPAKLQGFFVGVLDPIAANIDAILTKFESVDFAAIGQRIASGLNFDSVKGSIEAIARFSGVVLVDSFVKAIELLGVLLKALFSPEGLTFMKDALLDVFFAAFNAVGEAANQLGKTISAALRGEVNMEDKTRVFGTPKQKEEAAKDFADVIAEAVTSVDFAPSENVKKAAAQLKEEMGKLFPKVSNGMGQSPVADEYDRELAEQRARVAADSYKVPQIDGSTYGPARPMAEQFGPPKSLRSSRNGRLFGESARQSNRLFGESGQALGTDNAFAKDRERLGIASGLTTGGLGEKRRLNTSANDKEGKKNLTLQEKQVSSLESIRDTIGNALTVN